MGQGVYGNIKPANINIEQDIDIFYSKSEKRGLKSSSFSRLSVENLSKSKIEDTGVITELDGVFNLNLPTSVFGGKGYYNIYLKPKEYKTIVTDIGNLSFHDNVKGIIINSSNFEDTIPVFQTNGDASGYRIDFLSTIKNSDGSDIETKRPNDFLIITSNNRVSPITYNTSNDSQKSVSYRFDDNSTLWFLTVTPSNGNYIKSSEIDINLLTKVGERISIVNTSFTPKMIELDVVENDFDTLAVMVSGSQSRSIDDGIITTYDENNDIFNQQETYILKNQYTNEPIYEIRENKGIIDITKDFNSIKG